MIVIRESLAKPQWWEHCELSSISKLLETLLDLRVQHIRIHFWNSTAFIKLNLKPAGVLYYYAPHYVWWDVDHIINTIPKMCKCWRCKWRLTRKRYHLVADFAHLHR